MLGIALFLGNLFGSESLSPQYLCEENLQSIPTSFINRIKSFDEESGSTQPAIITKRKESFKPGEEREPDFFDGNVSKLELLFMMIVTGFWSAGVTTFFWFQFFKIEAKM